MSKKKAKLIFKHNYFEIVEEGDYVLCAISGKEIQLQNLHYTLKKEKLKGLKSIYAYEDGALESFIKAKNLGINCLYELPIGYWRSAQGFYQKEMKRGASKKGSSFF